MAGVDSGTRQSGVVKSGKVSVLWTGEQCALVLRENVVSCETERLPQQPPTTEGEAYSRVLFTVALEDVLGLQVLKAPSSSVSRACRAVLHTYEKKKKLLSDSFYRKVSKEVIEFTDDPEDFRVNYNTAQEWREAIQLQCIKNSRQKFVCTPEQVNRLEPLRLLVIINPFSGRKKSLKLYRQIVLPMFEIAGVTIVQELITERQGHAKEFIENFDLSTITGIVLASGDGIIYEVINGLMARPDWQTAIKMPLGLLPTGSGNAMVSSLLYEANEEKTVLENAVLQIVNGGVQSHDIASVITESSHTYMGALMHWTLTGDVDIESEKLRVLGGELRTVIGALVCIARKKVYPGQFSYLPIEDDTVSSTDNTVSMTDDTGAARPDTSLMPPSLSDPVPDNWKTVEGNFVVFVATMVSHMADTFNTHPDVKVGSGEFRVSYAQDEVTRSELFSALSDPENICNKPSFRSVRTRAFRLNPITSGIISIDGESVDCVPLQIQIHPGLIRLFARKN